MTNDERNPKPECRKTLSGAFAGFVIRICEGWFMESHHSSRACLGTINPPAPLTLTLTRTLTCNLTLTFLSVFRLRAGPGLRLRNLAPRSADACEHRQSAVDLCLGFGSQRRAQIAFTG